MEYVPEKWEDDNISYELPDGLLIYPHDAVIGAPEIMFTPNVIQNHLSNSIKRCDDDLRRLMYGNIVLSGGNTMFKGNDKKYNA